MKTTMALLLGVMLLPGCTRFTSTTVERTSPIGVVQRVTVVHVSTFLDSNSELARGGSGSPTQVWSGTNFATLVESIVGAAVRAAVRP